MIPESRLMDKRSGSEGKMQEADLNIPSLSIAVVLGGCDDREDLTVDT